MTVGTDDRASSVRQDTGDDDVAVGTLEDDDAQENAQRGTTKISDRVVEKIAQQAVREIDLATGAPRSVLGVSLGSDDEEHDARVDAHVDGSLVTVAVTMAVRWPASVRQVAEQLRRHLGERITGLTSLEVAEVDVDVTNLVTGRKPAPRVR